MISIPIFTNLSQSCIAFSLSNYLQMSLKLIDQSLEIYSLGLHPRPGKTPWVGPSLQGQLGNHRGTLTRSSFLTRWHLHVVVAAGLRPLNLFFSRLAAGLLEPVLGQHGAGPLHSGPFLHAAHPTLSLVTGQRLRPLLVEIDDSSSACSY